MNSVLMKAILAMDSYNRGYNSGIKLETTAKLGTATITHAIANADLVAQARSFSAVAYHYRGETVISYRGTDDLILDPLFGWGVSWGEYNTPQVWAAFEFYRRVAGSSDPRFANISLTGHSLGGALAGLVGTVYGKNATLFDSAAYEATAFTLHAVSDILHGLYNHTLKEKVYGSSAPWATYDKGLLDIHMKGEVLDLRLVSSEGQVKYDLGYEADDLNGTQLHSMASLVMAIYADWRSTYAGGSSGDDWKAAAKYFWPVLYQNTFAAQIGLPTDARVSGKLQTEGNEGVVGKYSDILRTIIAYSAIDEGDGTTDTQPFGDTGIKALYNDADDFGRVLSEANVSSSLTSMGQEISKSFVQFAAQLALNGIFANDMETATKGVLSVGVNAATLRIDFSDELWKKVNGGSLPNMIARADLIASIWVANGVDATVRAKMSGIWGNSSTNVFEYVVFATKETGGTLQIHDFDRVASKATMFVGSGGADMVYGSTGNDFVLGGAGDDRLYSGGGRDLLYGGLGSDVIYAESDAPYAGSHFDGGEGTDTLDYSQVSHTSGLRIDMAARTAIALSGGGTADSFANMEILIGTKMGDHVLLMAGTKDQIDASDGNDTFTVRSIAGGLDGDVLNGGAGLDTLDYSQLGYGVNVNLLQSTAVKNGGGGLTDTISNFEAIKLSNFDDVITVGNSVFGDRSRTFTIDGGTGRDTVNASGFIYNPINQVLTTSTGLLTYKLTNIENVLNSSVLPDYTKSGNYQSFLFKDYSHSPYCASFYFNRSSGGLREPGKDGATVNGVKHDFATSAWYYGDGLGTRNIIQGTNNGDFYKVYNFTSVHSSTPRQNYQTTIITGTGDDIIEFFSASGDDTRFVYTGGHDVYRSEPDDWNFLTSDIDTLVLGNGIKREDVSWEFDYVYPPTGSSPYAWSMINLTINIQGKGSIRLENFRITQPSGLGYNDDLNAIYLEGGYFRIPQGGNGAFGGLIYHAGGGMSVDISRNGDDELTGTPQNDTISSMLGDDVIASFDGNDVIYAGGGNDTLEGGAGTDQLHGGAGADIYTFVNGYVTSSGVDEIYEPIDQSVDSIVFGAGIVPENVRSWSENGDYYLSTDGVKANIVVEGSGPESDVGSRIERIEFANGTVWDLTQGLRMIDLDAPHFIHGSTMDDYIDGRGGDDVVFGHLGSDMIFGGVGADSLYGHAGNDTLDGGAGRDYLDGGLGNDVLIFNGHKRSLTPSNNYSGYDQYHGGQGLDELRIYLTAAEYDQTTRVRLRELHDLIVTGDSRLSKDVESLRLNISGVEALSVFVSGVLQDMSLAMPSGTPGDDSLIGRAGIDRLNGHSGNDHLYGFDGNDLLNGGAGDDVIGNPSINRERGDDAITGGAGSDLLYGGLGDDVFVFAVGDSLSSRPDVIDYFLGEGRDTVRLVGGIVPSDVTVWQDPVDGNYKLQFSPMDVITIRGWIWVDWHSSQRSDVYLDTVSFDSGLVLDFADLLKSNTRYFPSSSNDIIHATFASAAITIDLSAGDDFFAGSDHDDVITGGQGQTPYMEKAEMIPTLFR